MVKRRIKLDKRGKRRPITRTQQRAIMRPYAIQAFDLLYSWNRLHLILGHIFNAALMPPPGFPRPKANTLEGIKRTYRGLAVWYSTDNDFTQRNMLRAALPLSDRIGTDEQRKDVVWILNKIDKDLRHQRNNIVHAPLTFLHESHFDDELHEMIYLISDADSFSPRSKALSAKQLGDEFISSAQLASTLAGYAEKIASALYWPDNQRWPVKPKLPQAHKNKEARYKMHDAPPDLRELLSQR